MRFRHLLACLFVASPALAISGDEPRLEIGRWEETIVVQKVTVDGKALPLDLFKDANETTATCYGRNDVRSAAEFFMSTAGSECDAPQGQTASGSVDFTARCKMDDGTKALIGFKGGYGSNNYDIVMTSINDLDGKEMKMTGKMTGQFAGRCRGDEKE